jgi:hypothetical protein
MSREAPIDFVRTIAGTADLPAGGGYMAAAIAVESGGVLAYRGFGATRRVVNDFSDQTIAGAKTLTGTTTLSGTTAFTGATTGVRAAVSVTAADTATYAATDSGLVVIATKGSATQVFTLPAAATPGVQFTFVCAHASGEIRVGVATGDNIIGKTHGAQDGTGLVSTATTGLLLNTAAGNVVGDFVTLVSDGITTWYMVAVAGAWSVT